MRRPPRPTSFVTGLVSASRWRALMDDYRAHGPTLGVRPIKQGEHVNKEQQEHHDRVGLYHELSGVLQRGGDQSKAREKFIALGVPESHFKDGTAAMVFSMIGTLLGSLVGLGVSVNEAADWIMTLRWPPGAPCSDERRAQMGRMLVFAKTEAARLGGSDQDAIMDHLVTILATTFIAAERQTTAR